jgi:hypothetical protein
MDGSGASLMPCKEEEKIAARAAKVEARSRKHASRSVDKVYKKELKKRLAMGCICAANGYVIA